MDVPHVVELLGGLLQLVGSGLATPDRLERLSVAAAPFHGIPGEAVLEFHLGGRNHVDFTARLWPEGAIRLARSGKAPRSTLRFLDRWLSGRGALQRVPYVEFEQDIVDGQPFQWVGPTIRPSFDRRGGPATSAVEDYVTALAVLESLPDWPPEVTTLANLEGFFGALPPDVTVNMLSSLGARAGAPRPGVRLILSGPRWTLVDDILPTVTEPERLAAAKQLVQRYGARLIGFDLEIDGQGLRPYVAFYRAFRNPNRADADLRVFLDLALTDRLCSRTEHAQLLQLAATNTSQSTNLTFKVVARDNQPAQMKAYLEQLVY